MDSARCLGGLAHEPGFRLLGAGSAAVSRRKQQVSAYTEVFCPNETRLTIRSRLQSDYAFRDITVAQKGCVNAGCVINQPKGYRFYKLTCPRSNARRTNQTYHTDIILYPGTNKSAATPFSPAVEAGHAVAVLRLLVSHGDEAGFTSHPRFRAGTC